MSLGAFTLGRSPDSAIPLLSTSISRQHVQIEISADGILLTDLNSNNGTEVDGVKIPAGRKVRLKPTNRVKLGAFPEIMTFESVPLPMEMLKVEDQRKQMTDIMIHLRKELEDENQKHLSFEIERLTNKATSDYKRLMLQADGEIQQKRRELENETRKTLEDNQRVADQLKRQAEEEARLIQDMALANEMRRKTELQQKLEQIERETFEGIAKTKAESQAQADTIVTEARAKLAAETLTAQTRAEKILKDAEETFQKRIHDAELINQKSLDEARKLSAEIQQRAIEQQDKVLNDARERAQTTLQKAKIEADALQKESELKAQNIVKTAEDEIERELAEAKKDLIKEIERTKQNTIQDTERECDRRLAENRKSILTEQESIVASFHEPIEKLRSEKKSLEDSTLRLKTELSDISVKREKFEAHYRDLETKIIEASKDLAGLKDDVKKAEAAIEEGKKALELRDTMLAERDQAKAKLDRYQRDYSEGLHALEADLKTRKEQAITEYQDYKRSLDEKAAQEQLQIMETLKSRINDEEAKYNHTLKLRALELAETIDAKLKQHLGALAPEGLGELVRGTVLDIVQVQNSSVKAVTEHLGVDPARELEKRKKTKRWITAAASIAVLLTLAFHQQIFNALKQSGASGLSDYLVAKRTAESIYSPAQSDDWRQSYVGNVLYLRNYTKAKTENAYQQQWTLRLNQVEFLRSLNLNEDDIIAFQAKEGAFIEALIEERDDIDAKFLDDGLKKMSETESAAIAEMLSILGSEDNLTTIRNLERDFTVQYLKRRFGSDDTRTPAATE